MRALALTVRSKSAPNREGATAEAVFKADYLEYTLFRVDPALGIHPHATGSETAAMLVSAMALQERAITRFDRRANARVSLRRPSPRFAPRALALRRARAGRGPRGPEY
jgi:hypothetical protein